MLFEYYFDPRNNSPKFVGRVSKHPVKQHKLLKLVNDFLITCRYTGFLVILNSSYITIILPHSIKAWIVSKYCSKEMINGFSPLTKYKERWSKSLSGCEPVTRVSVIDGVPHLVRPQASIVTMQMWHL